MIKRNILIDLYTNKGKSAKQISHTLSCSENKVHYWLEKYKIRKRSISEATYIRANPNGDPFKFSKPKTLNEAFIYGLGLGLFWGEGNKVNTGAVRLGNTDPHLIKYFLLFLKKSYNIDINKLRFGIQIFNDTKPSQAIKFWCTNLEVSPEQFHKVVLTKQNKTGTYRKKMKNGVLTVYFSNKKLRDIIVGAITDLQNSRLPM
jgi:hypothetical protein